MKITATNWQLDANSSRYKAASLGEDTKNDTTETSALSEETDFDSLSDSLEELTKQAAKSSEGDFKPKSSKSDNSVGQLAAELARAETKLDVQQVSSKATRALINLKMSYTASSGDDQKKIAQMIRRMEKLIKRINKKLQHLGKEEQLEGRRKRAEKNMDTQKETLLRNELRTRRNKRRKDERNYAMKELAEDGKNATQEMVSGMTNAMQGLSSSPELAAMGDMSGGMDVGAMMGDFGGMDMMV